jgi:hypothetical protein
LMTAAVPLTAQESIDQTGAGPIRRTMMREAIRLAAESAAVDAAQLAGGSTNTDWSRVRKLEPGTEITVRIRGSQAGNRSFVSADEVGLTVLNLTDPTLPSAVKAVLREMASKNPGYLTGEREGGVLSGDVRVEREGIFVKNQKTADLRQLLERIPRAEVAEIVRPGRLPTDSWFKRHPAATGALVGLAIGLPIGFTCGEGCPFTAPMFGAGLGAAVGGLAGPHGGMQAVIYRAP